MLTTTLLSASLTTGISMTTGVLVQKKLPERLRAFRRSLLITAAVLFAMGLAQQLTGRVPSPTSELARNGMPDADWFEAMHEGAKTTRCVMLCGLFLLATLCIQVASIAKDLRPFVITQEVDLVARDQIALHRVAKAGVAKAGVSEAGASEAGASEAEADSAPTNLE